MKASRGCQPPDVSGALRPFDPMNEEGEPGASASGCGAGALVLCQSSILGLGGLKPEAQAKELPRFASLALQASTPKVSVDKAPGK